MTTTRSDLELVTVTFRGEDALQRLQARTIAQHAPQGMFTRIIVIDNDTRRLSDRAARRLRALYGPHAERVTVIPAADVADSPSAPGWVTQQILKLKVAELVSSPWYVLLDSKNHAIRPLAFEDFIARDGRAHGGTRNFENHPHQGRLRHVLDRFGLPHESEVDFPPTTTPAVMHTASVRELITHLSSERSFEDEFVHSALTEFFSYSAWLVREHGGWRHLYTDDPIQAPVVWRGQWDEAVARAADTHAPFFGVHRSTLVRLPPAAATKVARFWVERGIFDSLPHARRFLARAKADAALSKVRQILRRG